ncbi:tRNA pseudouridine(55) synthase TruB [Patescibacteria group bacterium]|uniref:tRNA pseudouridine(55) synthase n=1 Tax=viral metagenome TaxID=1070528 RepID=A0A6M3MAX4_9ZZZZ|nr:tRNA pseudouridine(55) synthase TruB [Patescibacteria group bacterium]MBU0776877.1 tRNA pseudouridine(55) synthase TruB [Patescibacteria group bacterium]MBU0846244.1 tRNA pseudouridine(55) synthase TruB [Patescibacteria group bacterium]MBU0922591.1 tRNA pseudouridine(55) synthase TruB [Patescibacteria group bacterium]MBU1066642.1 tRNA pseudouridine(55) synthase TruB [Patescibacteria group bacterium]
MFLLINKPKGITSHDVIYFVRKVTGEKKVGHAGTLDPNATGLLIVGVGRNSTKKLGWIAKDTKKMYEAEIFLGEERDTDDSEGQIISKKNDFPAPNMALLKKTLKGFKGKQKQKPPAYSALKIKGKKAYELARKGEKVFLKERDITIYSIELFQYKYPVLKIKTTVSSGTYIRALARDIGEQLGCGAYLRNLKRTGIGNFDLKDSIEMDKLTADNWNNFAIEID